MELHGEVLVAAPRERVWAALNDANVLQRCIPGCEAMEVLSDAEKRATVAVKVGPVRARFQGCVRLEDIRPGEGCTLQFEGKGGAAGMARGSAHVTLSDENGDTRLNYATQASVAGKLGQVGGRMIEAAARQMADQFFATFQAEVAPVAETVVDTGTMTQAEGEAAPAVLLASRVAAEAAVPDSALLTTEVSRTGPATTPTPRTAAAPPTAHARTTGGETSRVLWFVLGSLSTGFGVWLGHAFAR
jgi:carbon monoxide dehydrogenase subunit G